MNKRTRAKAVKRLQRRRMLDVLEQFRVIVKSIRRHYQDVERRAGLSGAQLWALAQIASQPGARVGELARVIALMRKKATAAAHELPLSEMVD